MVNNGTKKIQGLNEQEITLFRDKLGREPTDSEWAVCGALWSEHCSYKSTRVHLKRFHSAEPWVWQGPGENAGVIGITDDIGVAFKMESHNHPSYIEPYQGAGTGVGGILRDVFCMGARPFAAMNCLRFGSGVWNAHLLKRTTKGIADYGNAFGVPTVSGDTSFHEGYSENILVNAFAAGFVKKDAVFKGVVRTSASDSNVLVYFGSQTGPDGVHGATMSSDEFGSNSVTLKPTVQVGDPFAGKVLLEATLDLIQSGLVVGLQDMGAAGLTSSGVEMAHRSLCGVNINLDLIPLRMPLDACSILLSESQERMLAAVATANVSKVTALLEKHDIPFAVIGTVDANSNAFVCTYRGEMVVHIPTSILVDEAPKYHLPTDVFAQKTRHQKMSADKVQSPAPGPLGIHLTSDFGAHSDMIESGIGGTKWLECAARDVLPSLLSHANLCSRQPIFGQYCSTVQGNTVTGCGSFQESSSAVIRVPGADKVGVAVAAGCEERWVERQPYEGTILSTLKIARKLIAVGAQPLGMTDCLNFGSPQTSMGQFSSAVDGINAVAKYFRIPVVSGNVSLNNQTNGFPIPPTPMVGMVGKVPDVSHVPLSCVPHLSEELHVYWIKNGVPSYELGMVRHILTGKDCGVIPTIDLATEQQSWFALQELLHTHKPKICQPVGHGGVLISSMIMAFRSHAQLQFEPEFLTQPAHLLLGEALSGYMVAVRSSESRVWGNQKIGTLVPLASGDSTCDNWSLWAAAWHRGLKPFF